MAHWFRSYSPRFSFPSGPARQMLRTVWLGLALTGLVLAAGPLHAQQANDAPEIPVATLDGETLYLRELVQLAEQLPAEYQRAPFGQIYPQLVDELIDTRLAAAASRAASIDGEKEVQMALRLATDKMLAEIWLGREMKKQVDQAAIAKAYDAYVADTASREEVRAAHILVESEELARAIIADLDGGADFTALAKEKSTGPSGPNGGDLGYFKRGAMVPAFEAAAFALDTGSYTKEPVQTQFGWHVIKSADRRIAEPTPIAEMEGQLRQSLSRQALVRVLEKLRVDATVTTRSFEEVRTEVEAAQKQMQSTQ